MEPCLCPGCSLSEDTRPGPPHHTPRWLGGPGLCCPVVLVAVLQAGLGATKLLSCIFWMLHTGANWWCSLACSLFKDSLPRPVPVLPWDWQLFD